MRHIMIDLETMGTRPGCAIVSIGAVCFDPDTGEEFSDFYLVVDLESAINAGLHVDGSTVYWWLRQNEKARNALLSAPRQLELVLSKFVSWYSLQCATAVWSHGATFDIPIMEHALRQLGHKAPWDYTASRDTRTLFELTGTKVKKDGIEHHALDDARAQARAVVTARQQLRKDV